jgi:hypothetical protein
LASAAGRFTALQDCQKCVPIPENRRSKDTMSKIAIIITEMFEDSECAEPAEKSKSAGLYRSEPEKDAGLIARSGAGLRGCS